MNRCALKTCGALLSTMFFLGACATTQQPQATTAYSYGPPTTTPYTPYTATPVSMDYQRTTRQGYADGEAMLLDTIFLRPVSIVGVAVGAAAWIVSLPFSLPSGSTGEAWDALVETPLNYTLTRPLGDLTACRDVDPGCRYPYPW